MESPTLHEFWLRLKRHDWFFHMSDDHGVWLRGDRAHRDLRADAKRLGGTYRSLYESAHCSMFSGGAFGTPKVEFPGEPSKCTR